MAGLFSSGDRKRRALNCRHISNNRSGLQSGKFSALPVGIFRSHDHFRAKIQQFLSGTRFALAFTEGGRRGIRCDNQMLSIERILCPTDLSLDSERSLRYAAALARAYDAKLFVCYCSHEPLADDRRAREEAREEIERLVKNSLYQYVGAADIPALNWEAMVIEGSSPAAAITREAARKKIDLIVMRSRRRPYRAALFGSTTETVARTAPCPVFVTHDDDREWEDSGSGRVYLKRVLVACDFSDYSELALRSALSLAQEYQAELHLLHVLPPSSPDGPETAWVSSITEGAYRRALRKLENGVPAEAGLWCEVEHAVRRGRPYREILSYAEEKDIDLICIGAHGTGFDMKALFGSNVEHVLRQAPCPVLVARPLKPAYYHVAQYAGQLSRSLLL